VLDSECGRWQSVEGFSPSIVSDCLSRLEDDEKIGFDEADIRDFSGNLFGGEPS
jgi:hypothetical protein